MAQLFTTTSRTSLEVFVAKKIQKNDLIVYTYIPSTEEEGGLKFQAVLGHIVNCRPDRGTV